MRNSSAHFYPRSPTRAGRTLAGSSILMLAGAVLLLAYGALLLRHRSFAAGGADSSGYLNSARGLREGRIVHPIESLDRMALPSEMGRLFIPPRSLHYSRWTAILLTPLPPLLWLGAAVNERIPRRDRALLFSWFAAFFFLYSFYFSYDAWWYTRFLLPGVPALVLGALLCGRDFLARRALPRRVAAALAGAAFLVVLAAETRFIVKNGVHRIAEGDAVYAESSRLAERELPEKSLVLTMQLSGALEYDTEVPYVNWVWIEPGRFPEALAASAAARGYRWYALLAPFELEEARARLAGRWTGIGMAGDVTLWRIE